MTLAPLLADLLGEDLPVGIRTFDGESVGPPDPPATLVVRSPDALRRILFAPGEIGFARAYVAGDIDVEGDIHVLLRSLRDRLPNVHLTARQWVRLAEEVGARQLRPLPPPAEEIRLRGRRHSKARDASAVTAHYNVSNEFYRLLLGPALTYSCAVFESPDTSLEDAQAAKHDLICRKLDLQAGMRVLDIGCGWGSFAIHAATHYGVSVVGVSLSEPQVELGRKRVAERGLTDLVDLRVQDYRELDDGPFDAIASVGMAEHVGPGLRDYTRAVHGLLPPGARYLHHSIAKAGPEVDKRWRPALPTFIDRYVFPDSHLHRIGATVAALEGEGLEVRHVESLREHYALTLRRWTANLEASWDEAVSQIGLPRARIWHLYLAGCALVFDVGNVQVHQVLTVRPEDGDAHLPLRLSFED